jgi:hypothetical protein
MKCDAQKEIWLDMADEKTVTVGMVAESGRR